MKLYARIFPLLCILVSLYGCGQHADATVTLGVDTKSGPCIAGYNRITPGLCMVTQAPASPTTLTLDSTCRVVDVASIVPPTAKVALLLYDISLMSQNAVAAHGMGFTFWRQLTCASSSGTYTLNGREFNATTAGTELYRFAGDAHAPIIDQTLIYTGTKAGAGAHSATIKVMGYYD